MAWNSRDFGKSYFEHDDRGGGGGKSGLTSRRGRARFNNQRYHSRGDHHGRNFSRSGMKLDDDGDIQMDGGHNSRGEQSRFNPYKKKNGKGRGSGGWHNSQNTSRNEPSHRTNPKLTWNKILIPYGANVDQKFIVDKMTSLCDIPFVPVQYHTEGNAAVFYVEDRATAHAIGKLERKITFPNGRHMSIIVRYIPPPPVVLDEAVIEKIKEAMGTLYNAHTKALDLSRFASNPILKGEGIYAPLCKHNLFSKVIDLVVRSVPDIVGLDLSDNKIASLDCLTVLASKAPNMKVLLLAKNQLSRLSELDRIKSWDLEELSLDGNPVCVNYKDRSGANYISDVRHKFPNLLKLDGVVLPPSVKFALGNSVISLPTSQSSFFANEDARTIIIPFLQQYFTLYDSSNKLGLIDAYHEKAMMSLTSYKFLTKGANLQDYVVDSRNLLRVTDSTKRAKYLYKGREKIIAFLMRLPPSEHDPNSFSVDVTHASASLLTVSVNGVFKETGNKYTTSCIRSFNRVFVMAPRATGICIINEMLFVTNANGDQVKAAFKTPAPTPSSSPVPQNQLAKSSTHLGAVPIAGAVVEGPTSLVTDHHQQMIAAFSLQSGMNAEWAMKCLMDNNWDYDKSAGVFSEFHARGGIPPEAFVK